MPIQELVQIKQFGDTRQTASVMMAVNCAPLLRGIKASNMITVTGEEFYAIRKLVRGTDISCHRIRIRENRFMLFLYREQALRDYLSREDVQEFLREYGYPVRDFDAMLEKLYSRVEQYGRGEAEYPHEMGAFLQYPVEDIRGFLENDGENFSFYGYWKVYHNEREMKRLFARYDEERERVLRAVLDGRTIREIAV